MEQVLTDDKKCPYCAEIIKAQAVVCRFCNRDLKGNQPQSLQNNSEVNRQNDKSINTWLWAILGIIVLSIILLPKVNQAKPDVEPVATSIAYVAPNTPQATFSSQATTSTLSVPSSSPDVTATAQPVAAEQPKQTTAMDKLIAQHVDESLIGKLVEVYTINHARIVAVLAADNPTDYQALVISAETKDSHAIDILETQGKAFLLAPHTYAQVIDTNGGLLYEIHMQSGNYVGQDVWVCALDDPLHRIADRN
jgi:hypothetical protein